jgi:hypothetical protein
MQSTNLVKPTEFWWPHPDSLLDLKVEDVEDGYDLSAPDNTECGDWLSYWSQSPEHVQVFTDAFTEALKSHIDFLDKQNGKDEVVPVGSQSDREQAQDVSAGPLT